MAGGEEIGADGGQRFRGYNRKQVLGWLYYFSDMWELGQGGNPREAAPTRNAPTGQNPLRGYISTRLEDPKASESQTILMRAIEDLKKKRWNLWMRLGPVYFWSNANPHILDTWRKEAEAGSLGDKLAAQDHDEAVQFLLSSVEKQMQDRGLERLTVSLPIRVRGSKRRVVTKRRQAAVEILLEELASRPKDRPGRADAIKAARQRVSEEEGVNYSLKEIRVLTREIEGESE